MAMSRPSPRVSGAWFSDQRSPSRRLHVSWHGAERLIVLSVWHEDRCAASFRMPVQDAGKLIATIADAMSRALSLPSHGTEQVQPQRWQAALKHVQMLLRHRLAGLRRLPSDGGLRVVRDKDDCA
jgi:hypothetical protein